MATRIYVGRLSYRAKERDLEDFFRKYGRLRDVVIKNGFAFVEFEDARDAEDAAHYLNGKELCGERVIVELSKRPPKGRDVYRTTGTRYLQDHFGRGRSSNYNSSRSSPRGRDDGAFPHPTQTRWRVIVENLSSRVSWQDLKDFMRKAGEVCYADAHRVHKNEGIVCFSNESEMRRALDTLDGKELNGKKIKLIDGSRSSSSRSGTRSRSRSRSRTRSRSRSRSRTRSRSRSRSGSRSRSDSRSRSRSHTPDAEKRRSASSRSRSRSRSAASRSSRSRTRSPAVDQKRNSKEKSRSATRSPATRSRSRSASANGIKKEQDE